MARARAHSRPSIEPGGASAVLLTGSELVDGRVRDRNGAYLTADLARRGLPADRLLAVGDDLRGIVAAIRWLMAGGPRVLVISGGLGTTHDDLTAAAVAEALGRPLAEHADALAWVEERVRQVCERRALEFDGVFAAARRQALLPLGATPITPAGAAPGFLIEQEETVVVTLPGVPTELEPMWQATADDLAASGVFPGGELLVTRIYGVGELQVAPVVEAATAAAPGGLRTGITALDGEITVALRAHSKSERLAADAVVAALVAELPVFSTDGRTVDALLAAELRARAHTLAVAESCTGGLLGGRLTALPGSSDYFVGGVISYANEIKTSVLGVPQALLETHGAVSEPVAAAMASGARATTGATWGLAVTGVAGPDGGTAEKPVGLVYIACAGPAATRVERQRFAGDRESVRSRAVTAALHALRRSLGI
jgi:nicotinamide-nucleotide amidase